jgi:hypothetical protein
VIAETLSADTHKYQLTSENSSASGVTSSATHKNIKIKAVNDFRCSMGAAMQSMLHAVYITVQTMDDQANNRYKEKILLTGNSSLKKALHQVLEVGRESHCGDPRGH